MSLIHVLMMIIMMMMMMLMQNDLSPQSPTTYSVDLFLKTRP